MKRQREGNQDCKLGIKITNIVI